MKECGRMMKGTWKRKTNMKERKSGGEMKGWMEGRGRKKKDKNMKDLKDRVERRKMKLGWEGGRLRKDD